MIVISLFVIILKLSHGKVNAFAHYLCDLPLKKLCVLANEINAALLYFQFCLIFAFRLLIMNMAMDEDSRAQLERIARQLVEARKAKGLSLRALQQITGINDSNLSRIERAVLMPQLDTLCRIAKALDIKVIRLDD